MGAGKTGLDAAALLRPLLTAGPDSIRPDFRRAEEA